MITPEQRDYCGQAAHAAYLEGCRIMLKYEPITQPQWDDLVEESREAFRVCGETCFGDLFGPTVLTAAPNVTAEDAEKINCMICEHYNSGIHNHRLILLPQGTTVAPLIEKIPTEALAAEIRRRDPSLAVVKVPTTEAEREEERRELFGDESIPVVPQGFMAWDDLTPTPNEPFISLLDQEKLPPLTHEVHVLGGGGNSSVFSDPATVDIEPMLSTDEQEGE